MSPTPHIRFAAWATLAAAALGGGGCATTGPNHTYVTLAATPDVQDLSATGTARLPVTKADERVLGLAYDFNTDHLFLRLAPAQVIRVIERPSGKVLREMPLPDALKTDASADLAIRSSDRHLFAVGADGRSVMELELFGEPVRRFEPAGLTGPINGLAYDQRQQRLLVLVGRTVHAYTADGQPAGTVELAEAVTPVSLGFDSEARHYFVPLADGHRLGEFDAGGRLVATHEPGAQPITAVDAGQRSFVRVF